MALPYDIILVRHGQSEGNVAVHNSRAGDDSIINHPEFRKRHHSDWKLTPLGIEQAKISGDWLKNNGFDTFDRYYVSSYIRAIETAAHLELDNPQWMIEPRLRERERGVEDILDIKERMEYAESLKLAHSQPLYWKPLNGESIIDCVARIRDLLQTLHRETSDQKVILVCHGDTMRAFQAAIERWANHKFKEHTSEIQNKIYNGQILHYSRIDPVTKEISPYISFKRRITPNNPSLTSEEWQPVVLDKFSNQDLLEVAKTVPPFDFISNLKEK